MKLNTIKQFGQGVKYPIMMGALIALGAHLAASSAPSDATYKGSKICMMCHRTMDISKTIVASYVQTAHYSALQPATNANAIVADFSSAPFTKDKVAYVLGVGHRQQAYLDANFQLLPAEWSVATKSWVKVEPVDAKAQCIRCHTTGFDATNDTWVEMGVGCEMCHGPGSTHLAKMVSAPDAQKLEIAKQTILMPKDLPPQRLDMICGQCHSVGKDKDGHPFPASFRPGDDLNAVFTLAQVTGPGRNQQYNDYIQSKHYAAGITCITCHDPHGNTDQPDQLRQPVNQLCLTCHKSQITDPAAHIQQHKGAADAKCSDCHMPQGRHLFTKPAP